MHSFQQLYDEGKMEELLELVRSDSSSEAQYWLVQVLLDLDKLDEIPPQLLEIATEGDIWTARRISRIGIHYQARSQLDLSVEYLQCSGKLFEKFISFSDISTNLNRLGVSYMYQGKLDQALKVYSRALSIAKSLPYHLTQAKILNNIGEVHRTMGELDVAMNYYEKAINVSQNLDDPDTIPIFLLNMANIYTSKGDYILALQYLEKTKQYFDKIHDKAFLSYLMAMLIELYLFSEEESEAKSLLGILREFTQNSDQELIQLHYTYAQAIILKRSPRIADKVQAHEKFEILINQNLLEFEYVMKSLNHLIELLIMEYKMFEKEEVFKEIEELIVKMVTLAKTQHHYATLIEVFIIQSKMAVIMNDIENAHLLLTQALMMAEEKSMYRYSKKVQNEIDNLDNRIKTMNQVIESTPIIQRLEETALIDYIKRARMVGDMFGD